MPKEIQIGFEAEFLSKSDRQNIILQLDQIGIKISKKKEGEKRTPDKWWVVNDSSIHSEIGDPVQKLEIIDGVKNWIEIYAHELISPVFPVPEGMVVIEKIFKWMENNNCWTNKSTAFHIGVSFIDPAENKKINPLNVLMLLEETKFLKKFGRNSNRYCKPHKSRLLQKLTKINSYSNPIVEMRNINQDWIIKRLDYDKYHTVNFKKLSSNYLEFRIIGGKDYHKRLDDVKESVSHFIQCVQKSTDAINQNEYDKLVKKIKVKTLTSYEKKLNENLESVRTALEYGQKEFSNISQQIEDLKKEMNF